MSFSFERHAKSEAGDTTCLVWEGERIPFTTRKGSARRKRILIRLTSEGEVQVVLPPRVPQREALAALQSRGDWVLRQWRTLQNRPKSPIPRYVEGEEHLFLGEPFLLALEKGPARKAVLPGSEKFEDPFVTGNSQFIRLKVASDDPKAVHNQLSLWYKAQIRKSISERLPALCREIPWIATVPPWRVRCMRRRWGSCSGTGVITINTLLIKAPPACLEYVLLHELAHLREHNHSKRYYAVLEHLLPEWKSLRRELTAWAPRVLG